MTKRRDFLAQLGAVSAMMAAAEEASAVSAGAGPLSEWDTSWLDRLASAKYRVVFNASGIADGAALNYAATFLDHFREVHGTEDGQTRPVVMFRRLGTPMAFNDTLWERYPIGEESKTSDSATEAPARRNLFWKAAPGASAESAATKIETLNARGLISLVCNISVGGWSRSLAQPTQRDVEEVRKDVIANLVPGAILVPSGIYALIRAQNAGCAYMPGT